jgi:GMP synthase (glutamine-hydrolysing)
VYEDVLLERGAQIHRVELDEGDPLPSWDSFDAIVAMGGPMSVNDEDDHPWLRSEKRLIAEAVHAGKPFWGACLGVQLLAAALGSGVYAGPEPEVGILPVTLTDAGANDPVMGSLPRSVHTLQWHGDTFDLPEGAILLATSPAYRAQAFRFGNAYGLQFHLEVSRSMAEDWSRVPAYVSYVDRVLGSGSMPRLMDQFDAHEGEMRDHGRSMFDAWIDATVTVPT